MFCRHWIGLCALIALLGTTAGCGNQARPSGSDPSPQPIPPPDPKRLPMAIGHYEMDPAKHVYPSTAVAGQLESRPFVPDRVIIEGNRLEFRQGKDFFPDLSILIFLETHKATSEGVKLTIEPKKRWHEGVPSLHVSARVGEELPKTTFLNEGYALSLEIEKSTAGKCAGKIYLCLPGVEQSYLAGTFVAERRRTLSEPPSDQDIPYIQGKISPPMKKGQSLMIGYLGLHDGKVIHDQLLTQPFDDGNGGGGRNLSFLPRIASVRFVQYEPRFDFTRLPPSRYFVYARVDNGPLMWIWVDVPDDGELTADFNFEELKFGTLEVILPADEPKVRILPIDSDPSTTGQLLDRISQTIRLDGFATGGKAAFTNLPTGRYQVRLGAMRRVVEVEAGKTTTLELKDQK